MKQVDGIWLPDHEQHLQSIWRKWPVVDGAATYQYDKLELALKYVKDFRTAVDIGAHVGLWSRLLVNEFERVEAFEPLQEHRECFWRNVLERNVNLYDCALGAAAGETRMVKYDGNSGHSHVGPSGSSVVPMRTLDSFELEDVDFVKIDTEGYELHVLHGAKETLASCKPALIVEQKPANGSRYGHSDTAALDLLRHLGARQVGAIGGDYVFVW